MEVIAGHDPRDSTSAKFPVPEYSKTLKKSIQDLKIGVPKQYFESGLDAEVQRQIENCVHLFEEEGCKIVSVSMPHTKYAIATYYLLATAEASSNLARYDGTHYGYRAHPVKNFEELLMKSRSEGFGEEVKRRIMLGTYVLSEGYYKAYYEKAQKVRTLIRQDFQNAFDKCACILTPSTPTTAFKIDEKKRDPLTMYLSDIYTVSANLAGIPALSMPCGFDSQNLPIAIQFMSKQFNEEILLSVGYFLQKKLRSN
jgi:aspartyl-tRNA(Asn)/glutamyl-tRNA(Gln) amidotransferase subunit A